MHRINSQFEVFIPTGRAINPKTQTNWEGVGVTPDIEVSQEQAFDIAYTSLLKMEYERLQSNLVPGQQRLIDEIKRAMEKAEVGV